MTEPKTILFIDDDADDTYLFREVLATVAPDLQFTSATDGKEALEKLIASEALPHIIFMDLNMPRMNGKDCLTALKKHEKLNHIPVIIYTTSSYLKDQEEAMLGGAAYFITKPSSYNDLKEILSIFAANLTNLPQAFEALKTASV